MPNGRSPCMAAREVCICWRWHVSDIAGEDQRTHERAAKRNADKPTGQAFGSAAGTVPSEARMHPSSPAADNSPTIWTLPARCTPRSCGRLSPMPSFARWTPHRRSRCQASSPRSRAAISRRTTSATFLRLLLSMGATASRCSRPQCQCWPRSACGTSVKRSPS